MTDLEIRRIPFVFDETVPFQWHPTNLQFGFTMNVLSVMAVAFEKYIVAATRMAMPLIDDPVVAAEADAFLRQEAQRARAHRLHLKALSAQYPVIETILDDAVASFDRLIETKSLKYHLAYVAALESVSTPGYKSILDQHEELLAPGDTRVASMLAWHFVEEVEHRSSALIVYNSVVGDDWYKLSVWPRAMVHVFGVAMRAVKAFGDRLPREVTGWTRWGWIR